MEEYSVVKEYCNNNKNIYGIEKIKIPEKGECIIFYDYDSIQILK